MFHRISRTSIGSRGSTLMLSHRTVLDMTLIFTEPIWISLSIQSHSDHDGGPATTIFGRNPDVQSRTPKASASSSINDIFTIWTVLVFLVSFQLLECVSKLILWSSIRNSQECSFLWKEWCKRLPSTISGQVDFWQYLLSWSPTEKIEVFSEDQDLIFGQQLRVCCQWFQSHQTQRSPGGESYIVLQLAL